MTTLHSFLLHLRTRTHTRTPARTHTCARARACSWSHLHCCYSVAASRLPTVDMPLPLGSWTISVPQLQQPQQPHRFTQVTNHMAHVTQVKTQNWLMNSLIYEPTHRLSSINWQTGGHLTQPLTLCHLSVSKTLYTAQEGFLYWTLQENSLSATLLSTEPIENMPSVFQLVLSGLCRKHYQHFFCCCEHDCCSAYLGLDVFHSHYSSLCSLPSNRCI